MASARAAQERSALGKVDKIRADNAARAQALEREAADAEQKVCQRIEDYMSEIVIFSLVLLLTLMHFTIMRVTGMPG